MISGCDDQGGVSNKVGLQTKGGGNGRDVPCPVPYGQGRMRTFQKCGLVGKSMGSRVSVLVSILISPFTSCVSLGTHASLRLYFLGRKMRITLSTS